MQAGGNREEGGGDSAGERKRREAERGTKEKVAFHSELACVRACVCSTNLGGVDSSLLEGTAGGVMGTQVAVLAPVAAEGTVHARQTPAWTHTQKHTGRERVSGKRQRSQGEAASLPKWGEVPQRK